MNLTVDWTYQEYYDPTPRPFEERLSMFRDLYAQKMGQFPTELVCNPADADNWIGGAGMVVRVSDTVDRFHFYIGADLRQSMAVQDVEAVQGEFDYGN